MDQNSAIIGVFMLAVFGMLVRPLVVAWSRRIGGTTTDGALANEVDELRGRVVELEAERARIAELEERLDFAERLIAQRPDAPQLPMHRTPV